MIVYTGGTFDLFHTGHVYLLEQCRNIAGRDGNVIVGLNTDEFVAKYKGKPPVMNFKEREEVLKGCRYVDYIWPNFGNEDSKKTILGINNNSKRKIDMVVIGSDWHDKDYLKQMDFTWEWLLKNNINLCYVPRIPDMSSTIIKRRV